jgi:hypothetical protein
MSDNREKTKAERGIFKVSLPAIVAPVSVGYHSFGSGAVLYCTGVGAK